jgi:hypothetical protein
MNFATGYYDVIAIDGRNKEVHQVIEATDVKKAASIMDADAKYDKKWRRQFVLRPSAANCLVIDQKKGWGEEFIPPGQLPEDTQQVRFNGKLLYYIIRSCDKGTEGRLQAYKRPESIDVTPQKVYRATKIKELIILWCTLNASRMAKLIVGLLVALILGMFLILYLAIKS